MSQLAGPQQTMVLSAPQSGVPSLQLPADSLGKAAHSPSVWAAAIHIKLLNEGPDF